MTIGLENKKEKERDGEKGKKMEEKVIDN